MARGTGTIVNIASVVAIAMEALNGVYSASKSYVLTFGHSLQKELVDMNGRTIRGRIFRTKALAALVLQNRIQPGKHAPGI